MQGKKTIVTGGDSGIGRAVAAMFAMEGADVSLLCSGLMLWHGYILMYLV